MNIDNERAKFEAYKKRQDGILSDSDFWHGAWQGWLARAQADKAVSVEALEGLADGWDELSDAAYHDGEFSRRDVWRSAASRVRALIAKETGNG